MVEMPNITSSDLLQAGAESNVERSPCVLGAIPIIYYSGLLCVGLPVNILNVIVLSHLAIKTHKSSYCYLLSLSASDILTQFFIIFVGFILETAILHRKIPATMVHTVSVLEFAANHASIWITVVMTIDRYYALCHPLRYRTVSYPERTHRVIAVVFVMSLVTAIPFYWWSDLWRASNPPTALDQVLIWMHCFIIYFIPCTIFLIVNSMIVFRLKKKEAVANRSGKTTAILLTVTTVFAILWAPRTVVIIYHLYVASVNNSWKVHLMLDLANMLAMLSTAINFFLYCFVSKQFRSTVKEVLLSFCKH
ncbi:probable G-protein coupled receptor 142 [Leucoraja erinacea]|uniref:probable G-protein coupled receptor 142 n=1 Tax=Leucoraja erinaceus TaxID=7782 RepID=UPI002454E478|nr:probable G-protein coupled receptor 142 [Leucoraja erinacea]